MLGKLRRSVVLVAVAACVVLFALVLLWIPREEEDETAAPEDPVATAPERPTPPRTRDRRRRPEDAVLRPPEGPAGSTLEGRGFSLTGTLVDQDGDAIEGASVALAWMDDSDPECRTVTGADGRFRLPPAAPAHYSVGVGFAGGALAWVRRVRLPLASPLEIVIPLGGSLSGTVTLVDSKAAAPGVTVVAVVRDGDRVWRLFDTSDRDGRYRIDPLPAGRLTRVRADSRSGFATLGAVDAGLPRASSSGDPVERALVVRRVGIVRGRVLGSDGPLRAAVYVARRAEDGWTADWSVSDDDGYFWISKRMTGRERPPTMALVYAVRTGYHIPDLVGDPRAALSQTPRPPGVVDLSGPDDVVVDVRLEEGPPPKGRTAKPRLGRVHVVPGSLYRQTRRRWDWGEATGRVRGRVLTPEGEPVDGAWVQFFVSQFEFAGRQISLRVPNGGWIGAYATDPAGAFWFALHEGWVKVSCRAWAPGWGPSDLTRLGVEQGDDAPHLDLILQPKVVLEGKVRANGGPVAGAEIRVVERVLDSWKADGPFRNPDVALQGATVMAITDTQGRFRVDGLSAGRHAVAVVSRGHRTKARGISVPREDVVRFELD